jgi:hypothetical protein
LQRIRAGRLVVLLFLSSTPSAHTLKNFYFFGNKSWSPSVNKETDTENVCSVSQRTLLTHSEDLIMTSFSRNNLFFVISCVLASASFAQEASMDTSLQSQQTAQTQLKLSNSNATVLANGSGTQANGQVTANAQANGSATGSANNSTAAPAQNTGTAAASGASQAPAQTSNSASQTINSSATLSGSVDAKLAQTSDSVGTAADNAIFISQKTAADLASNIKIQTDFVQATANNLSAHTQATLGAANESLRELQVSTTGAVNEAVSDSVNNTVSVATTAVLNQEISNQVNGAVTQEIGKAVQSSIDSTVKSSVTQNLGLGL